MTAITKRIKNFIYRSKWLGEIMSSPCKAACHWVRIKSSPLLEATGTYGSYTFKFRGLDMPIVREIIHEGEYDFLDEAIKDIDTPLILDVGAHIGLFSLCMLNMNPKASIFSVEAGPDTFRILEQNAAAAKKDNSANWELLNRAAWSACSPIKFNDSGMSMSQQVNSDGQVEIIGLPLGELIKTTGHQQIDLMKVDIEGAEEEFLCASPDILQQVDRLVIELHNEFCDVEKVKELLNETYPNVKYMTDRHSSRPVLYCYK